MKRRYRAHWGFNQHAQPMSVWPESANRAGGVAILINPYEVSNVVPALEHLWSKHFIAITCVVKRERVLVANVYALQVPSKREALFKALAESTPEFSGIRILGGDFNCTQDCELDRSFSPRAAGHISAALNNTLAAWGLVDALQAEMQIEGRKGDVADFRVRHHTYRYKVHGHTETSRLDRLYVASDLSRWIVDTTTTLLGLGSDHSAVAVTLSDPATRVETRRQRKLYPPKRCAEDQVKKTWVEAFAHLELTMDEATQDCATLWESFKREVVKKIHQATKMATRKTNTSYRRKVTRLRQRIRAAQLQGEDPEREQELTAQLNSTAREWQALKRRRLSAAHSWQHRTHSVEFFKRVATRRDHAPIQRLDVAEGLPERRPEDLQNIMADAWTKVTNEPHAEADPEVFLNHRLPRIDADMAAAIDDPFTLAEIQIAIKRCSKTKSGGPDQLPNAWYRDYSEELAPILLKIYNECYERGVSPASFGAATVVCLKKSGRSNDPLNYRPIALLNTDYKIYARLLATRLKKVLPMLVDESQGGFVPGRHIHDVIDCFTAAQAAASSTKARTIAILLDTKKAYDSLNRRYMSASVKQRGFGPKFLQAIEATHANTYAMFEVNGLLSRPERITRGIRQGCPLAPLLFVLALDPLYRRILADETLRTPVATDPGIRPVAGYADDTALVLADEQRIPYALKILDEFAAISGLNINMTKSIVVRLCDSVGPVREAHGLQVLENGAWCRYLGIQVSSTSPDAHAWQLCIEQVTTRLRMAQIKTHATAQRAALAKAIIIPKLLYVARHCWPSRAQVDELDLLIRNFVWCGLFATTMDQHRVTTRGRTWMQRHLATMSIKEGGLGVSCVKTELLTMATTVVGQWAYSAKPRRRLTVAAAGWKGVDDFIQPLEGATPQKKPEYRATLWTTGERASADDPTRSRVLPPRATNRGRRRQDPDATRHQPMALGAGRNNPELHRLLPTTRQTHQGKPCTQSDGCARGGCTVATGADTAHIVWLCDRAQYLWRQVARYWQCHEAVNSRLACAIFTWQPPASKIKWRKLLRSIEAPDPPYAARSDRLQ